jgi:hypothetical protein
MRVYKLGDGTIILTAKPIIDLGLTDNPDAFNPKPDAPKTPPLVGRRKPGRPPGSKTKK